MGENKPVTKKKAQNASRAQKNESALSQTHLNDQNRRTPDPNTIDKKFNFIRLLKTLIKPYNRFNLIN